MSREESSLYDSFDPQINGLEHLLGSGCHSFKYPRRDGLILVLYGAPGTGKTLLACQIAAAACSEDNGRRDVLYLSKDASADTIHHRLQEFGFINGTAEARLVALESLESQENKHQKGEWAPSMKQVEIAGQPRRVFPANLAEEPRPIFSVCRFSYNLPPSKHVDRYAKGIDTLRGVDLVDLSLRSALNDLAEKRGYGKSSRPEGRDLMIVCDSIPPHVVSEQVRLLAEEPPSEDQNPPIILFVMEADELPTHMEVKYPPDILIRLGQEQKAHDVNVKTFELLKARYQYCRSEKTFFHIRQKGMVARSTVIDFSKTGAGEMVKESDRSDPRYFDESGTGISLLPILASPDPVTTSLVLPGRAGPAVRSRAQTIRLGIPGDPDAERSMDAMVNPPNLAGGGCTLLLAKNHCNSTAFGLHYLLNDVVMCSQGTDDGYAPRSVLYISLSMGVQGVLHEIKRRRQLRGSLLGLSSASAPDVLEQMARKVDEGLAAAYHRSSEQRLAHQLYKVPLSHMNEQDCLARKDRKRPYLYVYVPALSWNSPHEMLERVSALLAFRSHSKHRSKCTECLKIDRVVLDRVSRLGARWPLLEDPGALVSRLIEKCSSQNVDIMVIDDTAEQNPTSSSFRSRWTGLARNIVSLKRIPFHGSEAVALELLRAEARSIQDERPRQLISIGQGYSVDLTLRDSFRGYTGIMVGRPERCSTRVDLSFDDIDTPLHSDVMDMKHSLESVMEGIEVMPQGPWDRPGINSALCTLASISADRCHVVTIDSVWLPTLFEANALAKFDESDLRKIDGVSDLKPESIRQTYVTRAGELIDSVASSQQEAEMSETSDVFTSAIPLRHNWGVLAVARPSRQYVPLVLKEAYVRKKSDPDKPKGTDSDAEQIADGIIHDFEERGINVGSPGGGYRKKLQCVLGLLCGEQHVVNKEKENRDKDTEGGYDYLLRIYDAVWSDPAETPNKPLHWEDIARFRTEYWYPAFAGSWIEDIENAARRRTQRGEPKPEAGLFRWVQTFPRVDLFDCSQHSQECLVSFFLELLLATQPYGSVFSPKEHADGKDGYEKAGGRKLLFKCVESCDRESCFEITGFVDVLLLMYKLLAPGQRRRIAIGATTASPEDLGIDSSLSPAERRILRNTGGRRPKTRVALLSRRWLTSVSRLLPRYDIRQGLFLRHLPVGENGTPLSKLIGSEEVGIKAACKGKGPTVAGPWYVGALRGGQTDLAADLIKELTSKTHELDRMLSGACAPTRREFYSRPNGGSSALPYADVIRTVYPANPSKDVKGAPFPFYRTEIHDYTKISLVLYRMIREAMSIHISLDEEGKELSKWNTTEDRQKEPPLVRDLRVCATMAATEIEARQRETLIPGR